MAAYDDREWVIDTVGLKNHEIEHAVLLAERDALRAERDAIRAELAALRAESAPRQIATPVKWPPYIFPARALRDHRRIVPTSMVG